ncbi:hypothetical protein BRARA_D00101 [Brassica rapa]|uniref:Reticulon-like protein n=1 Tax=Brassica campestris TaxID=3711 RepID=A0A397ZHB7_BRACM|nr:hypothetical protein BRARA_D00101 [Brassica rapa]
MSTAAITAIFPPPPPVPIPTYITTLGLGYPIAIALGFLLLISTIILICCRASRLRFSASAVNGDSSFGGLDQAIINSYPKFPYTKEDGLGAVEEAKIYRLFGREKPVHKVLCGGLPAAVFLWRDKKLSAAVLGVATAIWVLFELVEYHLLSLVCHVLIFSLAALFLWSNAHAFMNKTPPKIPEIHIKEEHFLLIASALRNELNQAFVLLRSIALGRNLKKFLMVR